MARGSKHSFLILLVFFLLFFVSIPVSALTITQTEVVSVSALVGTIPSLDGGGGGGYQSGARFSGLAYPQATVVVLKRDGTLLSTIADARGRFSIFVPENDWQLFTLYAIDIYGRKSTLLNFPTVLYSGVITDITGIKFAPTITTDKLSVKQGDFIAIEGSSLPLTMVEILVEGVEERVFSLTSDNTGLYRLTIPASFKEGEYSLRVHYIGDSRTSKAVKLTVGSVSISRIEATTNIPGDCNLDQQVTLTDFSVLAYWYGKPNPPRCVDTNNDGKINLVDFSILAFYWNG